MGKKALLSTGMYIHTVLSVLYMLHAGVPYCSHIMVLHLSAMGGMTHGLFLFSGRFKVMCCQNRGGGVGILELCMIGIIIFVTLLCVQYMELCLCFL